MEDMEYSEPEIVKRLKGRDRLVWEGFQVCEDVLKNSERIHSLFVDVMDALEVVEYELPEGVLTDEEEVVIFDFQDKLRDLMDDLAYRIVCLEDKDS